jgi:hypothetical protein
MLLLVHTLLHFFKPALYRLDTDCANAGFAVLRGYARGITVG